MNATGDEAIPTVFLCPRCLTPHGKAGPCTNCGAELLQCRPGDPDDPCRKPLMTRSGQLTSHAPRWWLHYTVSQLMEALEREGKG